jgi:hypothetical protein
MADNLAPNPAVPERAPQSFKVRVGTNVGGQEGTVRFYEGVATDTDIPSDFARGAFGDPTFSPNRLNHNNPEAQYKHADETMRERAHVGSAAWVEAPQVLSDFVAGAGAGQTPPRWERVQNSMMRVSRYTPTTITE